MTTAGRLQKPAFSPRDNADVRQRARTHTHGLTRQNLDRSTIDGLAHPHPRPRPHGVVTGTRDSNNSAS
ncbi:hypothetical protein OG840_22380 [Streptomyces sp. NBC_01764]|uniref:hypothetical protein n=1 Tax=Streptomyces sp. NBC_01764 TaxID=2975935 RepID=UPI00225778BA|nr:hypothetical protein [Streptomyces sp. NBC_01764]MCX4404363.1 hypothetical protein [Streptomyces sp. NBC_01764]